MQSWRVEAKSHSKLVEVWKLIEKGCKARCVEVKCKKKRRILKKKTERWTGVTAGLVALCYQNVAKTVPNRLLCAKRQYYKPFGNT